MSLGNGTHWQGPLRGSDAAAGGLCEDVPAELVARRDAMFWWNDFHTEDDGLVGATSWVASDIGVAVAAGTGIGVGDLGVLNVDAGTANATGRQAQLAGTLVSGVGLLALNDTNRNGKFSAWEARLRVTPVTDGVALVGMCAVDVSLLTAADPALLAMTDGIFFTIASGVVTPFARRASVNGATTFTTTVANNVFISLGARVRPISVAAGTGLIEFYVNGVLRQRVNGSVPNVGLCPSLAMVNGTGVTSDLNCDYFWAASER